MVAQDVGCSRRRRRCWGCRLRYLWCRCWAGYLQGDPVRLDAVVGEAAYDIEQGTGGYILVAGLVVDVDGDGDALQERLGAVHSEVTSVTAARAALSSTIDAPAA